MPRYNIRKKFVVLKKEKGLMRARARYILKQLVPTILVEDVKRCASSQAKINS